MKALFTNKYVVTLLIFLVWMIFFDQNSFMAQRKTSRELVQLEARKRFYIKQNEVLKIQRDELFGSDASLEKLAREKYLMKRDDEDVYLINVEN